MDYTYDKIFITELKEKALEKTAKKSARSRARIFDIAALIQKITEEMNLTSAIKSGGFVKERKTSMFKADILIVKSFIDGLSSVKVSTDAVFLTRFNKSNSHIKDLCYDSKSKR